MDMLGSYLRNPHLVWNFQNFFGVEKCGEVVGGDGVLVWQAIEAEMEVGRGSNRFTRGIDKGKIFCTAQVDILRINYCHTRLCS